MSLSMGMPRGGTLVGDPDDLLVVERLDRVEHDRLARIEARLDPPQGVRRGRDLDLSLVQSVLRADEPDVIVPVLLEDRRLRDEEERTARVRAIAGLAGQEV